MTLIEGKKNPSRISIPKISILITIIH